MRLIGIAVIVGGWLITMGGLVMTTSTLSRAICARVAVVVSIVGILGVLNSYYLARAIWKK